MALDPIRPSPFIPLADIDPAGMSFAVSVPANKILPSKMPVPRKTTYREFGQHPYGFERTRAEEEEFGDYVYTHFESGERWLFYFARVRSDSEIGQPIASLTYTTSDTYPWPDVIKDIYAAEDPSQPMEVEVRGRRFEIPRLFLRLDKIEGGSFPSLFTVEFFASHKPFPPGFFQLDIPIPGVIYRQIRNLTINERGLHGAVELPETQRFGRRFPGFGILRAIGNFFATKSLPATNHTDWRDHVCSESVSQINGLYLCERRTVHVPRGYRRRTSNFG